MTRLGGSTVTVFGALTPLREGEVITEPDPLFGPDGHPRRFYVGGQSERSWATAWATLENALDEPGARVYTAFRGTDHEWMAGLPSRCASGRFGNCLTFETEVAR